MVQRQSVKRDNSFRGLTEGALKKNVLKSTVTTAISGDGESRDSRFIGRSGTFIR